MHLHQFVAIVALAAGTQAFPSHMLHEKRSENHDWVKRGRIAANSVLPFRIGLTQSNLDRGHDWLMELSSPGNPRYGKHYTAQEVHDLFAPSVDSIAAVRNWLEEAGVEAGRISQSANKQWIQFDASVYEAEALLHTKYYHYEHMTGTTGLGCDEYHVQDDIRQHIDYITPGVKMLATRRHSASVIKRASSPPRLTSLPPSLTVADIAANPLAHCNQAISPACIRDMYNFTVATTAHPGNELGVYEQGSPYDQKDLNSFFANVHHPQIPNGTQPINHSIDGGQPFSSTPVFSEANLDFEIVYPIIWPQQSVVYATNDAFYNFDDPTPQHNTGFLNTFLDGIDGSYCNYTAFGETGDSKIDPVYPDHHPGGFNGSLQCGVWKPTNVISISYSGTEAHFPANYQQRQCSEYMKLGMQGVSIVISSGDRGVTAQSTCTGPGNPPKAFAPGFPVNCPYVTTVGVTTLPPGALAGQDQEVASTEFSSGGGFSNIFSRPSYQDSAVLGFFKSPGAPSFPGYSGSKFGNGLYNRSGRGFPDVSAVGQRIFTYSGNQVFLNGGTSASAPIFASLLNRINEVRLGAGKSTVGFVNPVLYANPDAFHDITVGSNPGLCLNATTGSHNGTQGFNATVGWDPVTGLGTPNFPALLKLFTDLP